MELVRLCLQEGSAKGVLEALDYVERAKSRALVDMLSGALPIRSQSPDASKLSCYGNFRSSVQG
jgi:hypothetical protein